MFRLKFDERCKYLRQMKDYGFRMIIQSRNDGRYGYVITRTDDPLWAEASFDTFDSIDEAAIAAGEVLERYSRAIQTGRRVKI